MVGGRCALLIQHRKSMCWALFRWAPVCWDQVSVSVICPPRNLVLLTISTAVRANGKGRVAGLVLPEVYNDLFHSSDVQGQVVFTTVH